MPKLNPYLNFPGNTEEAFNFYRSVFGGEFIGDIIRYNSINDLPGKEHMSADSLNKVMHMALPIGENIIMGTDAVEGMGQTLHMGDNISLSVHADSREEADKLHNALAAGGKVSVPMADMFWGDYWGMLTDKFGITWMISFAAQRHT